MSTRAQLEERASGLIEEAGKHFAYRAAIAIHDLLNLNEREERHYKGFYEDDKIFDLTPASMLQERRRLTNYLSTLDQSIPRYWAVKLQILCLEHTDRREVFRRQLVYLENNPNIEGSKDIYEYLINMSSEARTVILGHINRARNFTVPDEENALQWAFEIMANQGRREDLWFIKSLKKYYEISRPLMDGVSIDPSEFGDIIRDEIWCVVTGTWGPASRLQAVRIVPSRVSTVELGAMFPRTSFGRPYHPENGLMLDKQIAENFEACRISIIPFSRDDNGLIIWEIRVMDSNLLKREHHELGCLFEDIHGWKLKFLNWCRPRQDYLQFQWFICLAISEAKNFNKRRMDREVAHGWQAWALLEDDNGVFQVRRSLISELSNYSSRKLPFHNTSRNAIMEELMARIFKVNDVVEGP
ncbi:hypothetical protein OCU04_000226 [Sclerotinia nivalis]|uniref:HNH nuclease domain-containing protein n=1 Tax=Sclerotinia nivalis TaxID=352851 RepID=A0A9X0DN73_9HELO|nr:hypothetical protein OCU04_000226 [Sclerotinia nivalis]